MRHPADTMPRPTKLFGEWLLGQKGRPDWIGELARAAARDAGFPRLGMPYDVLDHVRPLAADGDMTQAVDAAADKWFGGNGWRLQGLIEREDPLRGDMDEAA